MKVVGVVTAAFFLFAATVAGGILWVANGARGSGNLITESRPVRGFDQIAVSGNGTLIVKQGAQESLTIEAEDNIMRKIRTEVRGDRLEIDLDRGWRPDFSWPRKPITYTVTVKDLEAVNLSGSGDLEAANLTVDRLKVELGGSTDAWLDNITARDLEVRVSGSGNVRVSGTATGQELNISGSGDYDADGLASRDAQVQISGSGKVTVRVSEALDVRVSGSGDVDYIGNPRVEQNVSGSGNVRRIER